MNIWKTKTKKIKLFMKKKNNPSLISFNLEVFVLLYNNINLFIIK